MSSIRSYPKVWNLGHAAITDLLRDPVVVEEKIDGSQFSFGVVDGALHARSKGATLILDAAGMFQEVCDTVTALGAKLTPGWIYRGEYLRVPCHNSLKYDRVPRGHVMLFDIETGISRFLSRAEKEAEADRLGLEMVPVLYSGTLTEVSVLTEMLERESCLGGPKLEGVVIKNYGRFGQDGHPLMGKHVSEIFKEEQAKSWKVANPKKNDVLEVLCEAFRTEARWKKAVQRARDAGTIEWNPRDIGTLLKSVQADVAEESEAEVKDALWKWAKPHLVRKSVAGFPEWYKNLLMARQFAEGEKR